MLDPRRQRSRLYYLFLALIDLRSKARSHFLRDYDRMVTMQLATRRLDTAMATAVGGNFEAAGITQSALLRYAGLSDQMSLLDFGCGAGRLAAALAREDRPISYHGIDVNRAMLEYARSISPPRFRFTLNRTLSLPVPDSSADMVCAFSVFTHLKHTETYIYLQEIHRVLHPGGRLVFSFLEFASPRHWPGFEAFVEEERVGFPRPLNQFIERNAIDIWAEKLGFLPPQFIGDDEAPWGEQGPLGQSIAILTRR